MTFSTDNHSALGSIHQSNIMATLNHRIAVAKESHDQRLMAALEREYEQLTALAKPFQGKFAQPDSFGRRLEKLWMGFSTTLYGWSRVQIERTVDANGQSLWQAHNPEAGESIATHSESEMHQWIRKSYWCQ